MYNKEEKMNNKIRHTSLQMDPVNRIKEQARNRVGHQSHRMDPVYRIEEQARNTVGHQILRCDPGHRRAEQVQNTACHKVQYTKSLNITAQLHIETIHIFRRIENGLATTGYNYTRTSGPPLRKVLLSSALAVVGCGSAGP